MLTIASPRSRSLRRRLRARRSGRDFTSPHDCAGPGQTRGIGTILRTRVSGRLVRRLLRRRKPHGLFDSPDPHAKKPGRDSRSRIQDPWFMYHRESRLSNPVRVPQKRGTGFESSRCQSPFFEGLLREGYACGSTIVRRKTQLSDFVRQLPISRSSRDEGNGAQEFSGDGEYVALAHSRGSDEFLETSRG